MFGFFKKHCFSLKFWLILFAGICVLHFIFEFYFFNFTSFAKVKSVLFYNRRSIQTYRKFFGEYPVLKDGKIDFWEIKTNQYIWNTDFSNLNHPGSCSRSINQKDFRRKVDFWGKERAASAKEIEELFVNPITGKFDWLAEDASGTLYSPGMSPSILLTSPPIRVVNIRCPLKASDPPFFEDFTKW